MATSLGLRHWIIGTGVVMVAAFTASAAYDGWRLHEQVLTATDREIGNLSNALADETARTLDAVDGLLRDTGVWYESSGARLGAGAIDAALNSRTVGVPQVRVLTVVDANGIQRQRSRDTGEALVSVADRPYFTAQRDHPHLGMSISEPLITRTERVAGLVVAHRLNRPDGTFDGVVTAIVTLQRLQGMFSAIHLGDGSALLLALDDGTLIVRQPYAANAEGVLRYPELVSLKHGSGMDRTISPMDGRTKFVSAVGIGSRPLTLAITRDEEVALRPWYDAMWGALARTLVLSMLVGLTVAALLRQLARQQAGEQALRQSEERYAMAMEAANEGHVEWNLLTDTVFASARWREMHGIDASAVLTTLADLMQRMQMHPDDEPVVLKDVEEHLAGRRPSIEHEYRVRRADGAWRWVHVRGRCLRNDANEVQRLFVATVDVSDRKLAEAEKAFLELRLQQTQRLEALGTLAGGIAHDFNNILGAILGFGQMAQQHAPAGSALARHVDRVLQAGGRARTLVRRILDFSRSGVGERVPVHIQSVVEEAIAMARPSLVAGITITTRLEAYNGAVIGDPTQLVQVVMNVCVNAAQAMGAAGVVEVELTCIDVTERRPLVQGELAPGRYARLLVSDTGPGIPPEVLARMFDPFFTTKQVGEGTGLGLSVVHGIVFDLGGGIDVGTRDGLGTSMSIWLPMTGECEPPGPPQAEGMRRGHGEVVMIVDDEKALVELAEELLAELGYEPLGFDSAERALAAFDADPGRIDLVLTDEAMPGLSGTRLAEALLLRRPDLPIVLMSGNVGPDLEKRAHAVGIAELVRKPLSLDEIAETLARTRERVVSRQVDDVRALGFGTVR